MAVMLSAPPFAHNPSGFDGRLCTPVLAWPNCALTLLPTSTTAIGCATVALVLLPRIGQRGWRSRQRGQFLRAGELTFSSGSSQSGQDKADDDEPGMEQYQLGDDMFSNEQAGRRTVQDIMAAEFGDVVDDPDSPIDFALLCRLAAEDPQAQRGLRNPGLSLAIREILTDFATLSKYQNNREVVSLLQRLACDEFSRVPALEAEEAKVWAELAQDMRGKVLEEMKDEVTDVVWEQLRYEMAPTILEDLKTKLEGSVKESLRREIFRELVESGELDSPLNGDLLQAQEFSELELEEEEEEEYEEYDEEEEEEEEPTAEADDKIDEELHQKLRRSVRTILRVELHGLALRECRKEVREHVHEELALELKSEAVEDLRDELAEDVRNDLLWQFS